MLKLCPTGESAYANLEIEAYTLSLLETLLPVLIRRNPHYHHTSYMDNSCMDSCARREAAHLKCRNVNCLTCGWVFLDVVTAVFWSCFNQAGLVSQARILVVVT